jgi:16S rRNA (guanine527-N7)-methyltransferase
VDIGSGGGFPGLVVAILSREFAPDRVVTLVESDVRKSAFLRTVSQDLSLNTRILAKRIEDVSPLKANVLSARALADLRELLGYSARHLHRNGTALFMKGASWQKELEEARSLWSFDLRLHKSKTNPDAAILEIKDIQRV